MKFRIAAYRPGASSLFAFDEAGKLHIVDPFDDFVSTERPGYMVEAAVQKYNCVQASEQDAQPKTMAEIKAFIESFRK